MGFHIPIHLPNFWIFEHDNNLGSLITSFRKFIHDIIFASNLNFICGNDSANFFICKTYKEI